MKSRILRITATAAAALSISACGTGTNGGTGDSSNCAAFREYSDLQGRQVTVFTPVRGAEAEQLQQSWRQFVECTGVQIAYEGSDTFEAQIDERVAGGRVPDLALVPQPTLIAELAGTGKLAAADDTLLAAAKQHYPAEWLEHGIVDGRLYAAPLDANVKSLVWHSPALFARHGWSPPRTWAELVALSDTIAMSGVKPWCAGIESGAATGWPVTDWVEDAVLREQGPEVYRQWVAHEIPFDDPRIVSATDRVGAILKNERYVNGGIGDVGSIATTPYQEGGQPVLRGECALHRQAPSYAMQWPQGTQVGPDGDVSAFYLPTTEAGAARPVLVGGHFVVGFTDRPEVRAVRAYLAGGAYANDRARLGNTISPHRQLDPSNIPSPVDREAAALLQDPSSVVRFDGSDLMPSVVGAGAFWAAMTDWIEGADTRNALGRVEAVWPQTRSPDRTPHS